MSKALGSGPPSKSPIVALKLRERLPHAPSDQAALLAFNLRAYSFFSHPYFAGALAVSDRRVIFDSLAFRLRPIAMTDGDDSSIFPTIERLERVTGDADQARRFRQALTKWFALGDPELEPYWPGGWREEPPRGAIATAMAYAPTPVEELWDRVYGDGPHADFPRLLRTTGVQWDRSAQDSVERHLDRMLAFIAAIRDLVMHVHNAILDYNESQGRPTIPLK